MLGVKAKADNILILDTMVGYRKRGRTSETCENWELGSGNSSNLDAQIIRTCDRVQLEVDLPLMTGFDVLWQNLCHGAELFGFENIATRCGGL